MLEEDLRSPCTEEIAVFRAFARTVAKGSGRFVILDTAPTGHTLLLLDSTEVIIANLAARLAKRFLMKFGNSFHVCGTENLRGSFS